MTPEPPAAAVADVAWLLNPWVLFSLTATTGLALWRWVVAPRLPAPSQPRAAEPSILLPFLGGFVVFQVALGLAVSSLDGETAPHSDLLAIQTAANLAGLLTVLLLVTLTGGSPRALRLRIRRPLLCLVAAFSAWLAFLPVMAVASWLNLAALQWLGLDAGIQDHLRRFIDEGGTESLFAWASIALILPVCEEVMFRGALYGGLRRLVGPVSAMVLSGLTFGMAHDASVIVPVAALGMLFAWIYERTGSLLAPCLLHIIHNSYTLTLASAIPEQFQ